MPQSEDREVIVQFDSVRGLYFRELRPKRKLCFKCSRIPLAFFVEPGMENGFNFLPVFNSMLSNDHDDVTTIYNASFAPELHGPANYEHHTFHDLIESVKTGCHLCTLINRSLKSGERSALTPATEIEEGKIMLTHQVKRFPYGSKWDAIVPLHQRRDSNCGSLVGVGLYLKFMIAEVPGWEDVIEDDSSSESSFKMIQDMLQDCLKEHPDCNRNANSENIVPTRLLSVGNSDQDKVQLIETSSSTLDDQRYLALSHCWGLARIITTTTGTLGSRLAGIDESTLPKTFRDLILLARKLRVPYVWIDSLCIIQDSPEDWEKEASLMGRIYSSAFCTIAAAASRDGNGGLFIERNNLETQICDMRDFSHEAPCELYTQEEEDSHPDAVINIFPPRQSWERLIEQEVLSTRGWTFQERLLSPRMIHFTTRETVWECRSAQRSEVDYHMAGLGSGSMAMTDSSRIFDKRPFDQTGTIDFARWYRLVNMYTRRHFTKDEDRLAALSGLAQEVHNHTGWHYYAGLWEEDIIMGLAWAPNSSTDFKHYRPATYRAPSWSWASIEGPIKFLHLLRTRKAEDHALTPKFISIGIEPFLNDRYGKLKSGSLVLHGLLVQATVENGSLTLHQESEKPTKKGKKSSRSWLRPYWTRSQAREQQSAGVGSKDPHAPLSLGQIDFDIPDERRDQRVYLLQMLVQSAERATCSAMTLLPDSTGNFRRIGWAPYVPMQAFEGCKEVEVKIV